MSDQTSGDDATKNTESTEPTDSAASSEVHNVISGSVIYGDLIQGHAVSGGVYFDEAHVSVHLGADHTHVSADPTTHASPDTQKSFDPEESTHGCDHGSFHGSTTVWGIGDDIDISAEPAAQNMSDSPSGAISSSLINSSIVGRLFGSRIQGGQDSAGVRATGVTATVIPVSIYLADESIHEQAEAAVEQWIASAGVSIDTRDEPVIGSWFRRMLASFKGTTAEFIGREAALTAVHVADTRLVQAQDAYVTSNLATERRPRLAVSPANQRCHRARWRLLIVKIDWSVQVYQLSAVQQAILDHRPQLVTSPQDIIAALQLAEPDLQQATVSGAQQFGQGETTAATGN